MNKHIKDYINWYDKTQQTLLVAKTLANTEKNKQEIIELLEGLK